jgi:hypothetical protein
MTAPPLLRQRRPAGILPGKRAACKSPIYFACREQIPVSIRGPSEKNRTGEWREETFAKKCLTGTLILY